MISSKRLIGAGCIFLGSYEESLFSKTINHFICPSEKIKEFEV